MLERRDPFLLDHGSHFVEHLLSPPGHRHVVGIIAVRLGRLVVPHLKRVMQPLPGRRQGKVHHHRRATRQRRARPAFKIVCRISPHERHLEMRMRVNAARHHIAASSIQLIVARQPLADLNDFAAFDQNIRLIRQIRRHNGSILNHSRHCVLLLSC